MKRENFQKIVDGKQIDLFELSNKNGMKVFITNYGAKIVSILSADKNGNFDDMVLGFDTIDEYLQKETYFGTVCGRFANRIKDGKFTLEGKDYSFVQNNGTNHLHGGNVGFNQKIWEIKNVTSTELELVYYSPDGEEGYPGNLLTTVTYSLNDDNELKVNYKAASDKTTIVNFCQHSFFNIHGAGNGDVLNQYLMINADFYTPIDETQCPNGEVRKVDNTLMDFRQPVKIADRINADFDQFTIGKGIDNNWVVRKAQAGDLAFAASVYDEETGRLLEMFTTQPGVQVYAGNWVEKNKGKGGKQYDERYAICLEAQGFPNSPNMPHFPSPVLKKGKIYDETCIYKFSVK